MRKTKTRIGTAVDTTQATYPDAEVVLKALPALMGALDQSVRDVTRTETPMMLILFLPGSALYITNTDTNAARDAVRSMVQGWDASPAATEH